MWGLFCLLANPPASGGGVHVSLHLSLLQKHPAEVANDVEMYSVRVCGDNRLACAGSGRFLYASKYIQGSAPMLPALFLGSVVVARCGD